MDERLTWRESLEWIGVGFRVGVTAGAKAGLVAFGLVATWDLAFGHPLERWERAALLVFSLWGCAAGVEQVMTGGRELILKVERRNG